MGRKSKKEGIYVYIYKHHTRANKFQGKTYQANSPATKEHSPAHPGPQGAAAVGPGGSSSCVYYSPPSPVTLCTVWSVTLMVIMSLFCSGGPGTSAEPKHIFFVALAIVLRHKCFISPAGGLLARRQCPNPC